MAARAARRGILLAAPLWLALALPPAFADEDRTREPAFSEPQLPPSTGRIGRVRRDESGRIVPVGPPLPPERPAGDRPMASYPGGEGGTAYILPPSVPQISSFDPQILDAVQSRAEHERRMRLMQQDIDTIAREEAEAKLRGAAVNQNGRTMREESLLAELQQIDSAVQEHEMQHYFAGQPWARFPEYFYVVGPDGRRYAVSGITPFDTSAEGDAQETVRKLETLIRAALAPREPSEEDRRVAAALEQLIAVVRRQAGGSP